jgi:hypothetical protein
VYCESGIAGNEIADLAEPFRGTLSCAPKKYSALHTAIIEGRYLIITRTGIDWLVAPRSFTATAHTM